ncbi:MAG TPA: threonine--tRNA ligase, partial [Candidatus Peregrinibacteria bacterium]|nr:threonine--tRNA ligase [Candidatus Peregrinibacteria bacterium]
PAIDNGFYYDFDLPRTLIPEDLKIIEKNMYKIINKKLVLEQYDEPVADSIKFLKKIKQEYKVELAEELKEEGERKLSFYKLGSFVDLCKGPHLENTGGVPKKCFKLSSIAGAYWRGDEKRPMLQRIYGVAFGSKEKLGEYLKMLEEAKKRDHRVLGKKLELFSFHEEAPGFPFWHEKGVIIWEEILRFWHEKHRALGYKIIKTPIIYSEELWHTSGHWQNYKENMYFTEVDERPFAIKPMNCPGAILMYKEKMHSYREFPLRVGELGLVHRHELSGVLHGLFRVRSFTQDDAHIYCTPEQIEEVYLETIKLVDETYAQFSFTSRVELSTRPEKSIGTDEMWEAAESTLKKILKKSGKDYAVNEGDGSFYGPKLDFHVRDTLGREWQCATIQLDMSMPERFELEYIGEDGKAHRPVMIHRTVLGSLERFIGILIEHFAGALPVWLAPVQVALIPVADSHIKHAEKVKTELKEAGIRVEIHTPEDTLGKRIRNAELQKIPYMVVVGDKEAGGGKLAVRSYKTKKQTEVAPKTLIKKIQEEVTKRII